MAENLGIEEPIYIENAHTHRVHEYVATRGDGLHRIPIRAEEIWDEFGSIPDIPPAALLADNDTAGVVALRKGRALELVPGTTQKFRLTATPADLARVIPATHGQAAPTAGSAAPTLEAPPAPATGYTPVITDSAGGVHPMLAAEWVADGLNNYVEFPKGLPVGSEGENVYPQPLRLTFFEYVGFSGGGGAGSVVAFSGMIENVSGSTTRFAAWGDNAQNANVPCLNIAYPGSFLGFSVVYGHQSTAFGAGGGESLVFDVGTVPAGLATSAANFAPVGGATITWGAPESGTFPQGRLTGLRVPVAPGAQFAVRSVETGFVVPTSSDVTVILYFRLTIT